MDEVGVGVCKKRLHVLTLAQCKAEVESQFTSSYSIEFMNKGGGGRCKRVAQKYQIFGTGVVITKLQGWISYSL